MPDILGRIRPILASVLPWREPDERVTALKPWVRRLVTGYVLVLVPAIAFIFLMLLINAPRVLATGWDSFWLHWDRVGPFFSAGETARGAMSVFQMIVLVLPAAGLAYSTGRIGHRAGRFGWRWSDGSPTRRAALVAGTAAAVALAAFLLWPHGAYRPIQPWEKGTLISAVRQIKDIPSGRPSLTVERERELGGAPTERRLQREGHPRPLDARSLEGREPWGTDPWPAPGDGTPTEDPDYPPDTAPRARGPAHPAGAYNDGARPHDHRAGAGANADGDEHGAGAAARDRDHTHGNVDRHDHNTHSTVIQGGTMTRRRTLTALAAALALATGGLFAPAADADDAGTGPDQVIWGKTTGSGASDLLSGTQVGSYKGEELRSANVARADSTDCTGCRTVAVAVQAVLVKGSPQTATPTNAALAINENCLNCTTYAFAFQYIVSTKDRVQLTSRGRERVQALREQIDAAAHSDLAPDDLNLRLRELAADFRAAIDADLARQDEDVQDRQVERDADLG